MMHSIITISPPPTTVVAPPTPIGTPSNDTNDDGGANDKMVNDKAAELEEAILSSTTSNGHRHSALIPNPTQVTTNVSFDNKSYSMGHYKDALSILLWIRVTMPMTPPPLIPTHLCVSWAL